MIPKQRASSDNARSRSCDYLTASHSALESLVYLPNYLVLTAASFIVNRTLAAHFPT